MALSRCSALQQGGAAQVLARIVIAVDSMRSASGSRRISRSSSSNSLKVNTSALLSISPRAITTPDIVAPIFIAPPRATFALPPTDDLFRQFMQAYMKDRRPLIPAQALALEESKKQPLKAHFPDL